MGRQLRAYKGGFITGPIPAILRKGGRSHEHWAKHGLSTGSGFTRAMGDVDSLFGKAKAMGQNWLRGMGTARRLARANLLQGRINDKRHPGVAEQSMGQWDLGR